MATHINPRLNLPHRRILATALATCMLISAPYALAQSTSATIRGQVSADSTPAAGATVTARNLNTGLTRTVQADAQGNYSLAGLPPGSYQIDVTANGQTNSQTATVQVGQTATLNLGVGGVAETGAAGEAQTLDTVKVQGQMMVETKTSEIATYVTQQQMEVLPQASRNFLAFADTVPGMQFQTGGDGSTKLRSGAQSANNINVYIDGVGQKNYVLQGGISGQDGSRGNPFPQMAIGEYKVITSNYKAEYDQISSAAVTAVTKSGTNEFGGSFFWDYTNDGWRKATPSEERNGKKIPSKEEQYGMSFGGPIVKDVAHFFVSYEAKEYNSPRDVIPGEGMSINDIPDAWRPLVTGVNAPFKEDLYFGKLSWTIGENHLLELSGRVREESELTNVGNGPNTAGYGTNKDNEETRLDLRYQFSNENWLNDAHITYEDATYQPRPANIGPGLILAESSATNITERRVILRSGGGADYQDKGQEGLAFQNDLTFFGLEGHTIKGGIKYKEVKVRATEQQPYNPQYYFDINGDLNQPYYVRFGYGLDGLGNGSAESKNKQFGIYIQDDWVVNDHLTLNLGVRWDYEKSPTYLNYVTPQEVVDAFNTQDANAPAGQTYAQTLALGGIDINRYISTGNNRKEFKSAWQPRLGFSYDLFADQKHVIFGGAGRAYDRTLFDWLQLEQTKATFPSYEFPINAPGHDCSADPRCLTWSDALYDPANLYALITNNNAGARREINMLNNDLKTPYSDQYSLGMRNVFDMWGHQWNSSVTYVRINAKDGFVYMMGNRRPDGSFFMTDAIWGAPWGEGVPGFGSLILGTNGLETKSNQLLVSLDKPYTKDSGWGTTLAYTYTDAKENRQFGEHYALDYPTLAGYGWKDAAGVSKHRLVATGIVDGPWGLTFSGKLTLSDSPPYYYLNCSGMPAGDNSGCYFSQYKPDRTIAFKQLDLAVQKVWDTGTDLKLKARLDLLNATNARNANGYITDRGRLNDPNDEFGRESSYYWPTRTVKLSFGLDW